MRPGTGIVKATGKRVQLPTPIERILFRIANGEGSVEMKEGDEEHLDKLRKVAELAEKDIYHGPNNAALVEAICQQLNVEKSQAYVYLNEASAFLALGLRRPKEVQRAEMEAALNFSIRQLAELANQADNAKERQKYIDLKLRAMDTKAKILRLDQPDDKQAAADNGRRVIVYEVNPAHLGLKAVPGYDSLIREVRDLLGDELADQVIEDIPHEDVEEADGQ